ASAARTRARAARAARFSGRTSSSAAPTMTTSAPPSSTARAGSRASTPTCRCCSTRSRATRRSSTPRRSSSPVDALEFPYPESFDRQLGDRVIKRLKSPREPGARRSLQAREVSVGRDVAAELRALGEERILVLDGAWGVLLQGSGIGEEE